MAILFRTLYMENTDFYFWNSWIGMFAAYVCKAPALHVNPTCVHEVHGGSWFQETAVTPVA
jgi:hypothetical protein